MTKQLELYHRTSFEIARLVTRAYSTSFYTASKLFPHSIRQAIWGIYAFVRLADEIVDTFDHIDQENELNLLTSAYYDGFTHNLSLNPILHAFIIVVHKYDIPDEYVQSFLNSMRQDLYKSEYSSMQETAGYIYGSASVVGLMCLKVFCYGNPALFSDLMTPAMRLGSAFQKVNFIRDLKEDKHQLGRTYFPSIVGRKLDETLKHDLVLDIRHDFEAAYEGLKRLPRESRLAVLVAYRYYQTLLRKIERAKASTLENRRIRVSNIHKTYILLETWLFHRFIS